MIYVNLRGRIGNQLFIYACARELNLEYNVPVILCSGMQKKENSSFSIDLDQFSISDNISIDMNKKFPWYASNDFWPIKFARKLFPEHLYNVLAKCNVFLWLGETYKSIVLDKNKDAYIDGFWQSSRYFEKNKKKIINELIMKSDLSKRNEDIFKEICETESVCITIRRGDYISNPKAKKMFYLCDEKYFREAVREIGKFKNNIKLFVFSDDIPWAKNTLKFPYKTRYELGTDSVAEKLYLMSHCKHFIISNSSFSWWAQEMNLNEEKIVIAPRYWYTDQRSCDIYDNGWILI